jgi:hypothetical protein
MPRKTSVTPEEHDRRLRALADDIARVACERGIAPGALTRAAYYAAIGHSTDYAQRFYGPARELASGGTREAPPVDAIPDGHAVKGVSTYVGPDGRVKGQWVKTRAVGESIEDQIARMTARLPEIVPVREGSIPLPALERDPDLLAVYPLGDPHVGMLAWGRESGANFDLEIAERLMVGAVRDLVLRGPRASGALIVNLGDFFHFDNENQRTTHGDHSLDVDGRTARVLEIGLRIFVAMIDAALEHHDLVAVDCVAGNHDRYTSIMLALALRHYYRAEPRVSVPVDPASRHYWIHGRVLLGTTHGDRGRLEDLGSVMAAERPEAWGAAKHRHWLCGHVHHSQVKDLRGVTVETFRTLAARDSWHAAQGYVAQRDLRRIVYHRSYGEIERATVGIDYLERASRAE